MSSGARVSGARRRIHPLDLSDLRDPRNATSLHVEVAADEHPRERLPDRRRLEALLDRPLTPRQQDSVVGAQLRRERVSRAEER